VDDHRQQSLPDHCCFHGVVYIGVSFERRDSGLDQRMRVEFSRQSLFARRDANINNTMENNSDPVMIAAG